MHSLRQFLKISGGFMASTILGIHRSSGAVVDSPFKSLPSTNFQQEYYVQRLAMNAFKRRLVRGKIESAEDLGKLKAQVREMSLACYGKLPPRTPLNVQVTGRHERPSYSIENLIFESRPGYPVTANLYLPPASPGKKPAVLCTCGHSSNGKAYGMYQAFARQLAHMGHIALIYDPPGQGERMEYINSGHEGEKSIRGGTYVHNHLGNIMTLAGENFAAWEAWDGIRGIDYLLSREDVDPTRLGVTGNSGGGTQASHLYCLDERISYAAPSCFVTTFLHNLVNELPTDGEQVIPGWIEAGLDMADFFVAHIPKPVILIGQQTDFFDVRGLRETYLELKRLYAISGHPDNIKLHVGPGNHGFHPDGRSAMYSFFNKQAGIDGPIAELDSPAEPDATLHAAPDGKILKLTPIPKTTFDLIRGIAASLAQSRKDVGRKSSPVVDRVLDSIGVDKNSFSSGFVPGNHRVDPGSLVPVEVGRLKISRVWLIKNEPPSRSLLYYLSGDGAGEESRDTLHLHIPHLSAIEDFGHEVTSNHLVSSMESAGGIYALEVRGMGQLHRKIAGDRGHHFLQYYGGDYMYANQGFLLGKPLAGRRVFDILSTINLLAARGISNIHLSGRGVGSLYAQLATCIITQVPTHPVKIQSLSLFENLGSFLSLTENPRYQWPFSAMIPGVLSHFDLPEVRHAIDEAGTPITIHSTIGTADLQIH